MDLQAEQLAVEAMEGLPSTLTDRLSKEGVTHLFPGLDKNNYSGFQKQFSPVQRQVIPRLLSLSTLYPRLRPPDVCVAAPTGSGKTLAFVLPIVASLQGRMVPRVRAVAVLPTQDLALQVGFPRFFFIHSYQYELDGNRTLRCSKCFPHTASHVGSR